MYKRVLPVHTNECVLTKAKCVSVKRACKDYEVRTYINPTPFEILVFDVDKELGVNTFKKVVNVGV